MPVENGEEQTGEFQVGKECREQMECNEEFSEFTKVGYISCKTHGYGYAVIYKLKCT